MGQMLLSIVLFVLGFVLVIKGADLFVDAARWISDATGISRAVIGATVVTVATTAPEFFVSIFAAASGSNELAVANVVGSISINVAIAFAIIAFFRPSPIEDKQFGIKGLLMISVAVLLWLLCLNGQLSLWETVALLAMFVLFIVYNVRIARSDSQRLMQPPSGMTDETATESERIKPTKKEIIINICKFVFGAAAILLGARFIVDSAKFFASELGVSEALIGLTIVALGTSLPEIVTSITAVIKRESAISIGNVLGANILNISWTIPWIAFVSGGALPVTDASIRIDMPIMLGLLLITVLPTLFGKRTYRLQGLGLMLVYLGYSTFLIAGAL